MKWTKRTARWLPLVWLAGCAGSRALAVSDRLPPATLVSPTGDPQTLDGARGGKPALVNFWATWCDACIAELPALARLAQRAPSVGVVVLGIDVGEPRGKVAAWLAGHPLGYASLVDEEFALADAIGARRVPTTLVLDGGGRIVYRGGALDQGALDALVRVSHSASAPVASH